MVSTSRPFSRLMLKAQYEHDDNCLMDEKLISAGIGVFAGAVGYWINTFWMRPILQYRDLRMKVFADFIFYAQVVNAEGLNDRMKELYHDRVMANRRHSSDLAACLSELPSWYKFWLRIRGQSPDKAIPLLIGYSNTTDWDMADHRQKAIKKALGLPAERE